MEKAPDKSTGNLPVVQFEDQEAWIAWLEEHHATSSGVWLRVAKKMSGEQTVSYADALEAALCFGWIDGQKRSENEAAWLQRFTRRTKRSIWSKVNRNKAEALVERGLMRAAGAYQIECAKQDGRWNDAYDSFSNATVPADFEAALESDLAAAEFFKTLDRRNRYSFLFRIQTAKKAETREKRIQQFIQMLKRNEKFHP